MTPVKGMINDFPFKSLYCHPFLDNMPVQAGIADVTYQNHPHESGTIRAEHHFPVGHPGGMAVNFAVQFTGVHKSH